MRRLAEVHESLAATAYKVQQLASDHPDWTVERNQLRNWSILDENGDQVGHIDMIWGDVEVYSEDDET